MATPPDFEVTGTNDAALFTLRIFRGEGMCLLGMNWKNDQPPLNFVGFGIEYMEPDKNVFNPLPNLLSFLDAAGNVGPVQQSTLLAPIQKFRWVHFPPDPGQPGDYTYRVTPVLMDDQGALSYGEAQEAAIQLQSETYPGILSVAYTRGFVMSQAFSNKFQAGNNTAPLLPGTGADPLNFVSTNPQQAAALDWMGFEARAKILNALDQAAGDPSAKVYVAAYDLNVPEVIAKLEKLGTQLHIIIDNSGTHGNAGAPEDVAETRLVATAGRAQVQRQKMGGLQHNKSIAIDGNNVQMAIGGSTNFSWRGFFIQNNNAMIVRGAYPVSLFVAAFNNMWNNPNKPAGFGATASAQWTDLKLPGVEAQIAFSPHSAQNACLQGIADDIKTTTSSLLFSLAFLYQTDGVIKDAITRITNTDGMFVYGLSDKGVKGLDLQAPDGNPPVVFPIGLVADHLPEPFKSEASGGSGIHLHHKFVVIDFDKPTARVYMGSYNFSTSADRNNGENLWLIKDQRVAVSYMIQALSMFDHYEFRDIAAKATATGQKLALQTPPKNPGGQPWWMEDYTVAEKARDRVLFS